MVVGVGRDLRAHPVLTACSSDVTAEEGADPQLKWW